MVKFGVWSIVLLLGSLHGLAMAALLLGATRNRTANRFLAALLLVIVLLITPYTIGYAGFYDAWPWLTFAPFFWSLGIGPLLYLYVRQLGEPALPRGWWRHLVPMALQGAYYLALFPLPLADKWRWSDQVHAAWVEPALRAGTLLSLAVYLGMAHARFRTYQSWLEAHSAAREEFRLAWLRGCLLAMTALLAIGIAYAVIDTWIAPLDYFSEFPLYVAFAAAVYYLGLEGWRNAGLRYPARPTAEPEAHPEAKTQPPGRDWCALGERYRQRIAEAGWWREPELTLGQLAQRLGTNTHYLSRAFNEGLGMSFNACINRQRVDAACARLSDPARAQAGLLDIALEVGFSSKASFNRAFRTHTGTTPSDFRARRAATAGIPA